MAIYHHKDFLQDKDFITWCLTGDPHLQTFWEEYINLHPEEIDSFEKAVQHFSVFRLNEEKLTSPEENLLLRHIHTSIWRNRRKTQFLTIFRYAAVACIFIAFGLFLYHRQETEIITSSKLAEDLEVRENLDNENIYLITDSKTTSFTKDVQVQISKSGSAIVQEINGGKSTVVKTDKAVMNKLVVPYGKRSQLILSDGSKVWINSGSVLEFPSIFEGNSRSIKLTGEMFIDVTKDHNKPFFVNTPDFQVKVYGTKFNISAYQDDIAQSVVLVSGSVGIKPKNEDETYLKPNEMIVYKEQKTEKTQIDVTRYISWKDGYIILDKTPIQEVLKNIERYYNQSFEIQDKAVLSLRTCTGKIYLSDNLENVLETISILSSIEYKREGKTIHITTNP